MKKTFKMSLLAIIMFIAAISCKKQEILNANLDALDRNVTAKSSLDDWLITNYLNPYNIEVKYRFDPYEAGLDRALTPPKESQVIPVMETVRNIFMRPYEKVGGADFMKINSPKQYYLVGSGSFNGDGTVTAGTAEGGKKIALYLVNNFSKSSISDTKGMLHVIHHEFVHILNQKRAFDVNYGLITKSDYTANWYLYDGNTALNLGFISSYARANPIEDFAEMTSLMLFYGKQQWENIVSGVSADGQTKLRRKEDLVVEYFKKAWNIDFYKLQTEVTASVDNNLPALYTQLGPGKFYTSFTAMPSTQNYQSTEFLGLWNATKNDLNTQQGLTLTQYAIKFKDNGLVTVTYSLNQGATNYLADVDYNLSIDATGTGTFILANPQPTTFNYYIYSLVQASFSRINSYLTANTFKIDYAPNVVLGTKGLPNAFGAFYKSTDPTSFMVGTLN